MVLWGYSVFTSGEQRASTLLSRVRLRQRRILKMTMIMMGWDLRDFPWKSNLKFPYKLDKCQSIQVPDTPSILEVSGGLYADPY